MLFNYDQKSISCFLLMTFIGIVFLSLSLPPFNLTFNFLKALNILIAL